MYKILEDMNEYKKLKLEIYYIDKTINKLAIEKSFELNVKDVCDLITTLIHVKDKKILMFQKLKKQLKSMNDVSEFEIMKTHILGFTIFELSNEYKFSQRSIFRKLQKCDIIYKRRFYDGK